MTKIPPNELLDRIHELGKKIYAVEGKLPVLDRDTDAWKAWRGWRIKNELPVGTMDSLWRWTVITLYPPASLEELEKQYSGVTGSRGVSVKTREGLQISGADAS